MIKFINSIPKIIDEMMAGYKSAHPDFVDIVPNTKGVVLKQKKEKVSIVIGGGAGNEPWCVGFVGDGLADGAALGNVYTAPPAKAILAVTNHVFNKKGVLYISNNHAGDVLNFGLVSELAELADIKTKCAFVSDDIASAPKQEREERRGVAGICLAVKMAGAASEQGLSLEEVYAVTEKTNRHLHTLSVTSSSGYLPMDGKPMFEMPDNQVEYGMGFNGEPGIKNSRFVNADQVVDELTELLIADLEPEPKDLVVLLNGYGFTSVLELCIVNKRLQENFERANFKIYDTRIENWFSPQGTGGFSVTVLQLDEELKRYYDHPAYSPCYKTRTK